MTDYKIAIYIRLSLADNEKEESDSIGNQRMLINHYLDKHEQLSNCQRFEFSDDGYTATNFERPSFIEMMDRVKSGEINLICVKDFSRFSRDYVETGDYLECVFPFLGVRFISLGDGYDSDDYKGTTSGLEIVMRNIIYSAYSKDLSVKTTSAKVSMMKQGKYVGGYAPYGYKMHQLERNKLEIDEVSSKVVRRIFDEAIGGKTTSEISQQLNEDKILTPAQYFKSLNPNSKKFSRMSEKMSWTSRQVYGILIKYTYTGAMVSHQRKKANITSKLTVKNEPIIVENMQVAIVTHKEFEKANQVIRTIGRNIPRKNQVYPLRSLMRCAECKRALARIPTIKPKFNCQNSANKSCSINMIESDVETIVYNAIIEFISLANKVETDKKPKAQNNETLKSLQAKEEHLKSLKLRKYEKYSKDECSKEEYLKHKNETDNLIEENRLKIQSFSNQLSKAPSRAIQICKELKGIDKLTSELANAFIKAIYINKDNNIEIEWKFRDEFET